MKHALITGINFSSVRHYSVETIGFYTDKYTTNRNYLSIPLLFETRIKKTPIIIGSGVYATYLISARQKGTLILDAEWIYGPNSVDSIPEYSETNYNKDINERYNNLDFGLILQCKYELVNTPVTIISLITRLNLGLINNTRTDFYKCRNIGLMAGVGIDF